MTVGGRAVRDARNVPVPRRTTIEGVGTIHIRPLQYGDVARFYDADERGPHWIANLCRVCVDELDDCRAADVYRWRADVPELLETAIVLASELDSEDEDTGQAGIENPKPDDYEMPDHSLIGSGEELKPEQNLAELRESDTIHMLADLGHDREAVNRMLVPEIEQLAEGAERQNRRAERED